MSDARVWVLQSKNVNEVVKAPDQWAAWDTLRDRPLSDFGLVTKAEPDENADPFYIQTEALMRRWGREEDAQKCHDHAAAKGLI